MSRTFEKLLMWGLMAVLISVVSSAIIHYVAFPPSRQEKAWQQEAKYHSANDARFRSLFDEGTRAMKDARYTEALDDFQEAERSTDRLGTDQYASLKSSRQQIASLCESSGRDPEAQAAYKSLTASAMRWGQILRQASGCDPAIAEFEDAEKFSQHLTEGKENALLEARNSLSYCLQDRHRYSESVQTIQRMIDDIRSSSDEYDPALATQYANLAYANSLQNDWDDTEQALYSTSSVCDKIIDRFARDPSTEAEQRVGSAVSEKSVALRWLIIAYKNQGKTDQALSAADDFFTYKLDAGGRWGVIRLSLQREVAQLALQIATEANRQDDIELWKQRLAAAR